MPNHVVYTISVPMPAASSKGVALQQRRAIDRAMRAWQDVIGTLAPDEIETLAEHLESALASSPVDGSRASLIAGLSGGREISQQEHVALELSALTRYFQFRRDLLAGTLTASQVASLLGTSRHTLYDRVKNDSLLAILDHGVLRFPAWQFSPEGHGGVTPGLPAVLRALRVPPLSKVSWLIHANPYLDGHTPIDVLKQGDIERVAALANAVEADSAA